jgi:hypothetical protein
LGVSCIVVPIIQVSCQFTAAYYSTSPFQCWRRYYIGRPTTNQKNHSCSNSTTDSGPACSLCINPPHAEPRMICPRALAAASGLPPTASLDRRLDRRRTPHRSSSRRIDCTYCNAGRTPLRHIHCCSIPECGSRRPYYPIRGAGWITPQTSVQRTFHCGLVVGHIGEQEKKAWDPRTKYRSYTQDAP